MKFRINSPTSSNVQGSILIFSLWVLMLISVFTLAVGYSVRQKLNALQRLETREALRYVAEAGVKKARAILNSKDSVVVSADAFNQNWSSNRSAFYDIPVGAGAFSVVKYAYSEGDAHYENEPATLYGMIDEESKLNLNQVKSPQDLARLITSAAGIDSQQASVLAECILDWIDEDDNPFASGAESRHYRNLKYPYVPKNAALDTLEELLLVKGMNPEILRRLKPYLTVHGNGQININTVLPVVLNAKGWNESNIGKIISFRQGSDKKEGTRDDGIFTNVATVADNLVTAGYLTEGEKEEFAALVNTSSMSVASKNFEIRSVGRLSHRQEALVIQCVVERGGVIQHWQESYVKLK